VVSSKTKANDAAFELSQKLGSQRVGGLGREKRGGESEGGERPSREQGVESGIIIFYLLVNSGEGGKSQGRENRGPLSKAHQE